MDYQIYVLQFFLQPIIEEFSYPNPQDCAAGITGIIVIGRELHQNDLDLLARRGLLIMKISHISLRF